MFGLLKRLRGEAEELPSFEVKAEPYRRHMHDMAPKEQVALLFDVAKVWTYAYEERAPFMEEIIHVLPQEVKDKLIEFLSRIVPGWNVSEDLPKALSVAKKESLEDFTIA